MRVTAVLRDRRARIGAIVALGLLAWAIAAAAMPEGVPTGVIVQGLVLGSLDGLTAMGLVLIGIYPVAALDVFDYLLYGRLGLYWGANPLAQPPSRYQARFFADCRW